MCDAAGLCREHLLSIVVKTRQSSTNMLSSAASVRRTAPSNGPAAQLRTGGNEAHTLRICGLSAGFSSGCSPDRVQYPTHRCPKYDFRSCEATSH